MHHFPRVDVAIFIYICDLVTSVVIQNFMALKRGPHSYCLYIFKHLFVMFNSLSTVIFTFLKKIMMKEIKNQFFFER